MGMRLARPVLQFTLDGEFVAEFESCSEAAKQFGGKVSDKAAIAGCAGKHVRYRKTARGYKWEYKENLK